MESTNGESTINPKTNKLAELKKKAGKKLAELGYALIEKVVDLLLKTAEKLAGDLDQDSLNYMSTGHTLTR